jgi:hypothetical protein
MFKREEVRDRFNIEGNFCVDCLVSFGRIGLCPVGRRVAD